MASEVASSTATEAAQKEASQISANGNTGILGSSGSMSALANTFSKHASSLTQSAANSASSKPTKPGSFDQVMMETTTVLELLHRARTRCGIPDSRRLPKARLARSDDPRPMIHALRSTHTPPQKKTKCCAGRAQAQPKPPEPGK